jgi:hypothetical protein
MHIAATVVYLPRHSCTVYFLNYPLFDPADVDVVAPSGMLLNSMHQKKG